MKLLEWLCELWSVDIKNASFAVQVSRVIEDTSLRTWYIIRKPKNIEGFLMNESDFPHQLLEGNNTHVKIEHFKKKEYVYFTFTTIEGFIKTIQGFVLFLKPVSDFLQSDTKVPLLNTVEAFVCIEFINPETQKKITLKYTFRDIVEFCCSVDWYYGEVTKYFIDLFAHAAVENYLMENKYRVDRDNISDLIYNISRL